MNYIYLFIYSLFSFIAKMFPTAWMHRFLYALSYIVYKLNSKHRAIITANLTLAFNHTLKADEIKNIAIHTYYNLAQTIVGFMTRSNKSKEELLKNIRFENEEILLNALKNKEKIIFITSHYSNWELLPPAIASKYNIPLVGVGRKMDSEIMDNILLKNREKFGVEMVYRRGAIKESIKALKAYKCLGFLVDQALGKRQGGIKVNFFGKPVGHTPAASILARNFEATMIPAYISTEDYEHYTVIFYPPIPYLKTKDKEADILSMTQAQADITEQVIRKNPKEWFWVHKRWKNYLPEIYKKEAS